MEIQYLKKQQINHFNDVFKIIKRVEKCRWARENRFNGQKNKSSTRKCFTCTFSLSIRRHGIRIVRVQNEVIIALEQYNATPTVSITPPPLWPNPLHPQLYILAGWPSAHWRAVPGVLLILLFDCLAHLHAASALLSVCENQPRKMCKWAHNVNVAIVQNGEPARTMDTSR